MNPIGWIQGLEGLTLVAIICAFLFVEEVGVPLPFAPGDLLLAIAGIAVAAGRVNPLMMVGLAVVAILVGEVLGRELFALLGWQRLMVVARPAARAPPAPARRRAGAERRLASHLHGPADPGP